jgi:hypothetical protein
MGWFRFSHVIRTAAGAHTQGAILLSRFMYSWRYGSGEPAPHMSSGSMLSFVDGGFEPPVHIRI